MSLSQVLFILISSFVHSFLVLFDGLVHSFFCLVLYSSEVGVDGAIDLGLADQTILIGVEVIEDPVGDLFWGFWPVFITATAFFDSEGGDSSEDKGESEFHCECLVLFYKLCKSRRL